MDEGIIIFLLKMNFIVLFLFWEGLFLVLLQLIISTKEREIIMIKKTKILRPIISTSIIAILLIVMGFIYLNYGPQGIKGDKNILVEVITPDNESEEFKINTDAEFLRQALDEKDLIKGSDSEYGFFLTEVNGLEANADNQEWWSITKSGEFLQYGVNDIAIADGDHYEITLIIGY